MRVAVALQIGIALPVAIACSCSTPPPCQAYGDAMTVFIGTVTDALATDSGRISRARVRVERAYKGVSEETLILVTDERACADLELRVGEQYLVYADRLEDGGVASRGCSRSRTVKDAEEDLKYLDNLRDVPPVSTILGTVVRSGETLGDDPAAGALVEISSPDETKVITTDGEGHYRFDGLTPATYRITASQPGFRLSSEYDGAAVTASARGCAVVDLALRKDWPGAIEGRLKSSDDTSPPAGIRMSLIPVPVRGDDDLGHPFRAEVTTNAEGEYSFRGVPPGRYRIGMNLYQIPTPEVPYPSIYWPSASTEEAASSVEVGSVVIRQCDFRLPPKLKSAVVSGVVIAPDAKPGEDTWVAIFLQPDNAIVGQVPVTDAEGHFSFTVLDGFEYNLLALRGEKRSEYVTFSVGKGPQVVRLVLADPPVVLNDPW